MIKRPNVTLLFEPRRFGTIFSACGRPVHLIYLIGRFYTKDALSVWTNLGKHFVIRLVLRL